MGLLHFPVFLSFDAALAEGIWMPWQRRLYENRILSFSSAHIFVSRLRGF